MKKIWKKSFKGLFFSFFSSPLHLQSKVGTPTTWLCWQKRPVSWQKGRLWQDTLIMACVRALLFPTRGKQNSICWISDTHPLQCKRLVLWDDGCVALRAKISHVDDRNGNHLSLQMFQHLPYVNLGGRKEKEERIWSRNVDKNNWLRNLTTLFFFCHLVQAQKGSWWDCSHSQGCKWYFHGSISAAAEDPGWRKPNCNWYWWAQPEVSQ